MIGNDGCLLTLWAMLVPVGSDVVMIVPNSSVAVCRFCDGLVSAAAMMCDLGVPLDDCFVKAFDELGWVMVQRSAVLN